MANDLLMKHIAPGLGDIIAVLMFLSPLQAVMQARRQRSLGVGVSCWACMWSSGIQLGLLAETPGTCVLWLRHPLRSAHSTLLCCACRIPHQAQMPGGAVLRLHMRVFPLSLALVSPSTHYLWWLSGPTARHGLCMAYSQKVRQGCGYVSILRIKCSNSE
jgi:hypothetical protein